MPKEYDSTIIMYDFDRLKCGTLEFNNLNTPEELRKLNLRVADIQETIKALQMVFGGDILLVATYIRDRSGNHVLISEQPIALEVPTHISSRDIAYIKEIDQGLIVVM